MIIDMLINEDGFPVYPWCIAPLIERFLLPCATASDILAITIGRTITQIGK